MIPAINDMGRCCDLWVALAGGSQTQCGTYLHALCAANSDQLALIYFSTAFDILGDRVIALAHCAIFFNFQPPSVSLSCKDYLVYNYMSSGKQST